MWLGRFTHEVCCLLCCNVLWRYEMNDNTVIYMWVVSQLNSKEMAKCPGQSMCERSHSPCHYQVYILLCSYRIDSSVIMKFALRARAFRSVRIVTVSLLYYYVRQGLRGWSLCASWGLRLRASTAREFCQVRRAVVWGSGRAWLGAYRIGAR